VKIHFLKINCIWKQSHLFFFMPCDLQRPVSFEVGALSRSYVFSSFNENLSTSRSRDSSVGTSTRYGLNGPEIKSRWGRDFPHLSRPAVRPAQLPIEGVPGLSWE